MSTDPEREARSDWRYEPLPDPELEALAEGMWRTWMAHQVGTAWEAVNPAWPDKAAPYAQEATRCAAIHVAAGCMPRPEPGSPEWEAMVERACFAFTERSDFNAYVFDHMDAALRAALGTGDA